MQFKRGCAKGFLIGLALSLIPISALGAEKITPGSTCKVSQQKVTYLNRTFTCIKSGKKLIWNKGTLVTRPTPTPTPTMIAFLSAPPPNLGEITTKVECLNSPCIYNGPVPQGSIIVLKSLKDDWQQYGQMNGITQISFKLTSPSGKITYSIKYPLPYIYDTTSWGTAEIGIWNLQIAGWQGNQQTDWSTPKSVQVTVLPQSANGLKPCSPDLEAALKNGAGVAANLMQEIEYGWTKWKETKDKYDYAQNLRLSSASEWYKLLLQWDDYLRQRYSQAKGLYASYENAKKTCNTLVAFPKYVEPLA